MFRVYTKRLRTKSRAAAETSNFLVVVRHTLGKYPQH